MNRNQKMNSNKKLHISLSTEGILLSINDHLKERDLFLPWNTQENFSMIMENHFQLHLVDLQEIDVTIINNKFLLIPDEYFSTLFISSFLDKAIGVRRIENCELHHQKIEKEDSTLSYYIPSTWKDFISIRFPLSNFTFSHFLGNQLLQTSKFLRNQMHVWIENDLSFVILRKNGKLQLANTYSCKDAIELAFYLHSIRETFDFIWTNDSFSIYGERLLDSVFQKELIEFQIPINTVHEQA